MFNWITDMMNDKNNVENTETENKFNRYMGFKTSGAYRTPCIHKPIKRPSRSLRVLYFINV